MTIIDLELDVDRTIELIISSATKAAAFRDPEATVLDDDGHEVVVRWPCTCTSCPGGDGTNGGQAMACDRRAHASMRWPERSRRRGARCVCGHAWHGQDSCDDCGALGEYCPRAVREPR